MRKLARLTLITVVLALAAAAGWAQQTMAGTRNLISEANGGQIVKFSSQLVDENGQPIAQWAATNLIDGMYVVGTHTPENSYGWCSQNVPSPAEPEWIIFQLPEARLISRIVIDPTTDDPEWLGRWVKNIRLSVSTQSADGPYTDVGSYLVMRQGIKQTFDFTPREARWIKLDITSNWGSDFCVGFGEFEVYEAVLGDDELDQLISRLDTLLLELKRYRDSQANQQAEANTQAVTAPPAPAAPAPAAPAPAAPVAPAP